MRSRKEARERGAAAALLETARAALMRGEVGRGLACLKKAWRDPPLEGIGSAGGMLDFLRVCLELSYIHDWLEAGDFFLGRAAGLIRGAAPDARRPAGVPFLLEAVEARHRAIAIDLNAAGEFFDRQPAAARGPDRRPRLEAWEPWLANFYLETLLFQHRYGEFDRALRKPPVPCRRYSRFDAAFRLRLLGYRLMNGHASRKALVVLASAEKIFRRIGTPEAEYHRLLCLLKMGKARFQMLQFEEGKAAFLAVEKRALELRLSKILDKLAVDRAKCQRYEGNAQKGLELMLRTSRRVKWAAPDAPRNRANRHHLDLLSTARMAILAGKMTLAGRLLQKVEAYLIHFNNSEYAAFFHSVKAEWLCRLNTPESRAAARRELAATEELARRRGELHSTYQPLLTLLRGWLAFHEKNIPEAAACALACPEPYGEKSFLIREFDILLLQSALLHEREAPRPKLYERILPRLGSIRDPETLLRILANLYVYTWELDGQIELTDLHLKQIRQLESRMPRERFEHLYGTLVAEPILNRLKRRLFGA